MGITVTDIQTELGALNRKDNRLIQPWVYANDLQLAAHCKTIPKVNGEYPIPQAVMDHVVQAFRPQWDAMGTLKIKANRLRDYRQKVNLAIKANDVYKSWVGDLYVEGKKPADQPISQYIMNTILGPSVKNDMSFLEIKGVFGQDNQAFGASMDGIEQVLLQGVASATQPMIRNVLSAPLSPTNIVDRVIEFERYIQTKLVRVKNQYKKLFMSATMATNYRLKYEALYGVNMDYTAAGGMLSKVLRLEIVPIDYLDDQIMFCSPEGNMVRLIDVIDPANAPAITDIQVLDYDLKVFMEFTLGYGFLYNQAVCVATYSGASGLAADHDLFVK